MIKKDSLTKIKAKMFEEFEDMDLKEKEAKAERMRKEEFQKAKNKFKPQKDEETETVRNDSLPVCQAQKTHLKPPTQQNKLL